jgi:hypothetical protein
VTGTYAVTVVRPKRPAVQSLNASDSMTIAQVSRTHHLVVKEELLNVLQCLTDAACADRTNRGRGSEVSFEPEQGSLSEKSRGTRWQGGEAPIV